LPISKLLVSSPEASSFYTVSLYASRAQQTGNLASSITGGSDSLRRHWLLKIMLTVLAPATRRLLRSKSPSSESNL